MAALIARLMRGLDDQAVLLPARVLRL